MESHTDVYTVKESHHSMLGSESIRALSGILSVWGLIQRGGGRSLNGAGEITQGDTQEMTVRGGVNNWSAKRAVQLSQQRSKSSLISRLERIKSLKSDFF